MIFALSTSQYVSYMSLQRYIAMLDMGMKLEGLYRHASTHAAGVVIGDRPLADLVPLYKDEGSELAVTQFSMKYVELAGLLKKFVGGVRSQESGVSESVAGRFRLCCPLFFVPVYVLKKG